MGLVVCVHAHIAFLSMRLCGYVYLRLHLRHLTSCSYLFHTSIKTYMVTVTQSIIQLDILGVNTHVHTIYAYMYIVMYLYINVLTVLQGISQAVHILTRTYTQTYIHTYVHVYMHKCIHVYGRPYNHAHVCAQ